MTIFLLPSKCSIKPSKDSEEGLLIYSDNLINYYFNNYLTINYYKSLTQDV